MPFPVIEGELDQPDPRSLSFHVSEAFPLQEPPSDVGLFGNEGPGYPSPGAVLAPASGRYSLTVPSKKTGRKT